MKVSIFDFDGTLAKNEMNLGFLFAEHLIEKSLFNPDCIANLNEDLKRYSHDNIKLVNFLRNKWAEGLKGKRKSEIEKEAYIFSEKYISSAFHGGSGELIEHFKRSGYFTAIISASPIEALKAVLEGFGIDIIIGTSVETMDGVYTGKLDTYKDGMEKGKVIEKLFKEQNLDPKGSFAFGDTKNDLSMLEFLGITGIALHPNEGLEKIAIKKNWFVCHDTWQFLNEFRTNNIKTIPIVQGIAA